LFQENWVRSSASSLFLPLLPSFFRCSSCAQLSALRRSPKKCDCAGLREKQSVNFPVVLLLSTAKIFPIKGVGRAARPNHSHKFAQISPTFRPSPSNTFESLPPAEEKAEKHMEVKHWLLRVVAGFSATAVVAAIIMIGLIYRVRFLA
jgi:hypothetical protein